MVPEAIALDARYEFVRELGRGAMGIVFLATDRRTGQEVAIKLLDARHATSEDAVRRFVREARTVSALDHPRIVRTMGIEPIGNDGIAIVSQYVPGETLRALIRREGALPYDRGAAILRDVAGALAHAHRARIVHRDVKPENIFIASPGGEALLADFGIARAIDGDTQITTADLAIGTPSYMAPEQIAGLPVDERADVYSLGLVGWEIVTGARPWAGETLYSILHKQQHEILPSLAALRPDIPAFLLAAIEGATSKARDRRWRDGAIFLARLTPTPVALPESHRGRSVWEASAEPEGIETMQLPPRMDTLDAFVAHNASEPGEGDQAADGRDAERAGEWPQPTADPTPLHDSATMPGALPIATRRPWHRRTGPVAIVGALLVATALVSPLVSPLVVDDASPKRSPRTTRRVSSGDVASTAHAPFEVARLASVTVLAPPLPVPDSARVRTDSAIAPESSFARARTTPPTVATERPAIRRGAARTGGSRAPATRRAVNPTRDPRCRSPRRQDQSACLMGHIAVADVALNRTYRAVIGALRRRAGGVTEPPSVRALRREQRAWLVRRDVACRQRVRTAGRALWGLERAPCYAAFSRQRNAELRARLRRGR